MDPKQHKNAHVSGRTGGQYSVVRAALGFTLLAVFVESGLATLRVHDLLSYPMLALGLASGLALCLAIGWHDAKAAVGLLFIWGFLVVVHDWHSSRGDWILIGLTGLHIAMSCCRPSPYGACSAIGRVDPGGGWQASERAINGLWLCLGLLLLGLTYLYLALLVHPGLGVWEVIFIVALCCFALATLASVSWLRAWRSTFGLCVLVILVLLGFQAHGSMDGDVWRHFRGPWVWFLFLFEPAWIQPRRSSAQELVFYDGECGLCHRAVRFLLSEDVDGRAFALAPLQGETFAAKVSAEQRAQLPDSLIVLCDDGRLLTNSSGIVHMLLALGGLWRVAGSLLFLIPKPLRDAGYRFIASIRKRIFATPKSLCPLLPPELGARFLP